ncbi:MAG TPA: YdcF family protein [Candidatus Saccharimonadales bacterium]|nr:YdcF family protein [Candidatus Saccharimonadales bacterium]
MKTLISIFFALVVIVVGLSIYLAPNDLAGCKDQPGISKPCMPVDAIVAISGGDTSARTKEAVDLYQNGWARKLIFSGAARDKTGPSNAEAMRREARAAGVPDGDILTEELGETTKQNAANTQDILDRNSISSVILVTSAYHQRRAGLEFNARAAGTVKIYNHPVTSDKQWSQLWWLTPTGWYLAISEFVKIILFYVGGTR